MNDSSISVREVVRFPYKTKLRRIQQSNFRITPSKSLSSRSNSTLQKKSSLSNHKPEENLPEITTLKARSKDLISPYSIRTRELSKLIYSKIESNKSEKVILPSFPSTFKLKKIIIKKQDNLLQFLNGKMTKNIKKETNHSFIKSNTEIRKIKSSADPKSQILKNKYY